MKFDVHARLVLLGFVLVALGGCSGTSQADVERAEALAQDPIFERTAEMWSPTTDIVVRPGVSLPASASASSIYQLFELGPTRDPTAEMLAMSVILDETGWFDLVANCDDSDEGSILILSGQKEDEIGYVFARVRLTEEDSSTELIARVEIRGGLVDDPITEFRPRGEDVSCLSE